MKILLKHQQKCKLNKALIHLCNNLMQKVNNDRLFLRKDLTQLMNLYKLQTKIMFQVNIKITDKYILDLLDFEMKKLTKKSDPIIIYLSKYKDGDVYTSCHYTLKCDWEMRIDSHFTYENYNKTIEMLNNIVEYEDKLIKICLNRKNRFVLPINNYYIDVEFIYNQHYYSLYCNKE